MSKVYIYLRAIENKGKKRLSLFDSNGVGDIDDLITKAYPGDQILWVPDKRSGIQKITAILPKSESKVIFKSNPKRMLFCEGFTLCIPKDAKGEESYGIEFILKNGEKHTIDPTIRIPPPPD